MCLSAQGLGRDRGGAAEISNVVDACTTSVKEVLSVMSPAALAAAAAMEMKRDPEVQFTLDARRLHLARV